jgi:hypothetical protein
MILNFIFLLFSDVAGGTAEADQQRQDQQRVSKDKPRKTVSLVKDFY